MASLSNINGLFDVHSTGAILFSTSHGTSGQILKSNGNAAPTWIPQSDIVGAYLPLAGGTLTGATATASGISFTVGGVLTGTTASFNAGATNVVATFTSTDGIAGIALVDSSGNVELSASGNTFQVQPAGGVAALTVSSTNATFAGNVGVGMTPDTSWGTNSHIINLGIGNADAGHIGWREKSGADELSVGWNVYHNNTNWYYASNNPANLYTQDNGTHKFQVAAGGTADNIITWTDSLSINSSGNATFAGNVGISGTLTIGGNSAITRSGSTAQGRLAIWQNDTAIKGDNNLFYASQYLTVGVGTAGGFAAIRINSATAAQSYLDFTEGASFTKRAQIQVDTNDNMYFRNTSSNSLRMTLLSGGNFGIGDSNPASKLVVAGRVQANSGSEPWAFVSNPTSGNYGGFLMQYGNNTKGVCYYNSNSIIVGSEGAAIPLRLTTNGNYVAHFSGTTGNMHVGGISDQTAKLYVTGGTTLAGTNNNSDGAIRMYGDRKLPQATYFVKRNYNLTAGASGALYSIARQWHDHANWGLGNINVIMWGIYYGQGQFNKADFSCRYGYSGGGADVQTNFNTNNMTQPSWTAATQVSGNTHYRDLRIQIPAYHQISFEIISPGCVQTYDVNNTAGNTVYLYPH